MAGLIARQCKLILERYKVSDTLSRSLPGPEMVLNYRLSLYYHFPNNTSIVGTQVNKIYTGRLIAEVNCVLCAA